MREQGYKKTNSDHCIFFQKFSDGDFILLLCSRSIATCNLVLFCIGVIDKLEESRVVED